MIERFAAALVGAALAACPPAFRREYGVAIRADFDRAFADERRARGARGALAYACAATYDILASSLQEFADVFFRDFFYAVRALRKTPSFSAIVVGTLALAIGANAAVFSILNASVLAPIPYADPGRLVALRSFIHGTPSSFSLPNFADLMRRSTSVLSGGAAFAPTTMILSGRGLAQNLRGIETTSGLFATLGARPEIGRFPNDADATPGAARVVVVSDALWRRVFGARADAIGSLVQLNERAYRIVGVAPPGFAQPDGTGGFAPSEFWTLVPENGAGTVYAARGYQSFDAVARLQPGASVDAASDAVAAAARALAVRYPDDDVAITARAMSLTDALVGGARPLVFALFAAVGVVLLVACANVANLLLSRAAAREREFSVRIAVGASRGRIAAQLLVETFVLALAGGALGIGIAYGVVRAFVALHPADIPRVSLVTIDLASILYTFGIVAFCTLAAGLAPALAASDRDVATALKSAGRGGDGSRGIRARSALVACEIAMTLALVVSAGLVLRSFLTITSQPLGFDPAHVVLVGPIDSSQKRFASTSERGPYLDGLLRSVRATAGVRSADLGYDLPFSRTRYRMSFDVVGRPVPAAEMPEAVISLVGSGFFTMMHVKPSRGRAFDEDDRIGERPVVIVNETFARRFYGGRSPIGGQLAFDLDSSGVAPTARTIVGVVPDLRTSFTAPNDPMIYAPERQISLPAMFVVAQLNPGADPNAVADAVPRADPLQPRPAVARYGTLLANGVAAQRLSVVGLSSLAFVALALALAGIFAIVSYGVAQRTHEFGVRMALGADARQILRTVLGGAMRITFAGIVLGLLLAGAGTRLLGDQLYGTQPLDPPTFAIVTVLVVVATLVAALVPARRATRVDPIVALRYE